MRDGDLLMFADWRGDPDERLTDSPGTEVGTVFAQAAGRGVDVRGLLWRSHWDRLAFSAAENRQLGDKIINGSPRLKPGDFWLGPHPLHPRGEAASVLRRQHQHGYAHPWPGSPWQRSCRALR